MIIIACVDEKWGTRFNGRRQSRDRILCGDMLKLTEGSRLWMDEKSRELFEGPEAERILTDARFLEKAGAGEYCFVEGQDLEACRERLEGAVLYRWNRVYPSDQYWDQTLLEGMRLKEEWEFAGSSHEIITREVYVRFEN
ncbi:MAG TPA: ribonuclease Z [Candidatus Caccousia stercoris]|uniref:Ribonuclease Z n=1 Tax=Candidatus Caccousia stercoris TaxID=2840723 RepID=A0A9D1FRM1_9FIRM|nr:ribonuclease Z [Candidatus Caccousia stercoris]